MHFKMMSLEGVFSCEHLRAMLALYLLLLSFVAMDGFLMAVLVAFGFEWLIAITAYSVLEQATKMKVKVAS